MESQYIGLPGEREFYNFYKYRVRDNIPDFFEKFFDEFQDTTSFKEALKLIRFTEHKSAYIPRESKIFLREKASEFNVSMKLLLTYIVVRAMKEEQNLED